MENEVCEYGIESQEKIEKKEDVTPSALSKKFYEQQEACYYSGRLLTKDTISLDHKQPLSKGGKHKMSNVALCSKTVNRMKGAMTEQEFVRLCADIAINMGAAVCKLP